MKKTENDCNTEETCSTEKTSKLTTVKTVYARTAVVLLALNFCLTGYVVYNMNKTTQAQIDGITGTTAATKQQVATGATTAQQTPQTTDVETPTDGATTTPTPVTTREK